MGRIKEKKITSMLSIIILWIFGVFFLFMSFASAITTEDYGPSYSSAFLFFLAAIITIPPSVSELEKKLNTSISGIGRFFVVFLLVVQAFSTISEPTLVAKPTLTPVELTETSSASINLNGEKTNFVKGEDILFKLSAVNLITKPTMHAQVIIIPPSGMSVSSSEFVESGAGQYTSLFDLESGKGRDIEVKIVANQVGNFNVNGRVVYYFGDSKKDAEDYTFILPIQVGEALDAQSNTK